MQNTPTDLEAHGAASHPGSRRLFPLVLVAGLILLAALVAAATFGLLLKGKSDVEDARAEALDTARSYAVTLMSYDHTDPQGNIDQVLAGATGEFKEQYTEAAPALKELMTRSKASAVGTVREVGVKTATEDRAEVMLFVDQALTENGKQPRTNPNRMLLTLERVDGRWLVSVFELL